MKKSITIIILIVCMSALSFSIGKNWKKDDSFSMAVQEYLENREDFLVKSYQPLDINAKYPDMGIVSDDLKSYDVYLLGGNKEYKINGDMESFFIKYFVEKQGVKNIVLDIPFSVSVNLNKYIQTGDTNYIKSFSEYMLLSGDYKIELNRNWQLIKKYSDSLSKDKKFKITGFNMNVNPYYTSYIIKNLLKGKNIESIPNLKNLEGLIKGDKGDKVNEQDIKKLNEAALKIKNEIENAGYKTIFKDDYLSLRLLINELESSTRIILNKYSKDVIEKQQRSFFKENYDLYSPSNTGKYFASLDVADTVNNSFNGTIYKIGILYIKSNGENPIIYNDLLPYIDDNDTAVAFKTKGKYSPFNYENVTILSDKYDSANTAKISDDFNLIVVVKSDKK
ncbi:MAG: hypothetical protein LIR50_06565 [Bacillota bacterium]|nr:hypothetical protein [Bacillota bacterium]